MSAKITGLNKAGTREYKRLLDSLNNMGIIEAVDHGTIEMAAQIISELADLEEWVAIEYPNSAFPWIEQMKGLNSSTNVVAQQRNNLRKQYAELTKALGVGAYNRHKLNEAINKKEKETTPMDSFIKR